MGLAPIFKKAYWLLALCGLIYILLIYSLTYPVVQRGLLYSNFINPSKYYDVNDLENFGFLKSQVQPFNLHTPDNATLYAWHILPLHLYKENEDELLASYNYGVAEDVTKTRAFDLLATDPNARVIVQLHGNAASIGSGHRPAVYRNMAALSTPSRPIHVIAFDYRGFGISTGTPTEEGLITDAATVINYLTSPPLSIHPSRIAVVGQSLGTAVAAGLAERLTFGTVPSIKSLAGYVLIAPFSNIPELLETYCFMGVVPPILSPLMGYPHFKKYVLSHIIDTWNTASRVARLTGVRPKSEVDAQHNNHDFELTVIHAANDPDIPWREGQKVWKAAVGEDQAMTLGVFAQEYISEDNVTEVRVWERKVGTGHKRIRWERVRYGGHNVVSTYGAANLAVMRIFDEKR